MSQEHCDRYETMILDEAGGELQEAEERALLEHVSVCERCRESRVSYRKQLLHARSLLVPEPSSRYWDSFVPRLHHRISESRRGISVKDVQKKLAEKQATQVVPMRAVASPGEAQRLARVDGAARPEPWVFMKAAAVFLLALGLGAGAMLLRRGHTPREERVPTPPQTVTLVPIPDGSEAPDESPDVSLDGGGEVDDFVGGLSNEDADLLQGWLSKEVKSS